MTFKYNEKIEKLVSDFEIVGEWTTRAVEAIELIHGFIEIEAIDNMKYIDLLNHIMMMKVIQEKLIEIDAIPDFFKFYMEKFDSVICKGVEDMGVDPYHAQNEINATLESMMKFYDDLTNIPY